MAYKHSIRRFRSSYATLLRLYPKRYRERFGEPMEQTFNDLLRERAEQEEKLFGFALWIFVETFAGIIRENLRLIIMQNIKRKLKALGIIAMGVAICIALIWLGEYDDAPGASLMGILLMIGAVVLGVRTARRKT